MIVTFLSDYGTADPFVGLCHAEVLAHAPHARIIDLTHAVGAQDVTEGAIVLADAIAFLPPAVHLAVVDPGVGTSRRGLVARAGGHLFVAPDNGLVWPALLALGGPDATWALDDPPDKPARTFDGRDVFAPAAGRLAAGADPAALGEPLAEPVRLDLPGAEPQPGGGVVATVLRADRFGNLALSARPADLPARPGDTVSVASRDLPYGRTFADAPPGRPLLLADAFGRLQIAVNGGSAAAVLGLAAGARVVLRPGPARTIP